MKTSSINLLIKRCVEPEKPARKATKPVIEIEQHEVRYRLEAEKNQSILETALKQGIPLDYKCKQGTCGKCKVKVISGFEFLEASNQLEEKKLRQALVNNYRLACQAIGI